MRMLCALCTLAVVLIGSLSQAPAKGGIGLPQSTLPQAAPLPRTTLYLPQEDLPVLGKSSKTCQCIHGDKCECGTDCRCTLPPLSMQALAMMVGCHKQSSVAQATEMIQTSYAVPVVGSYIVDLPQTTVATNYTTTLAGDVTCPCCGMKMTAEQIKKMKEALGVQAVAPATAPVVQQTVTTYQKVCDPITQTCRMVAVQTPVTATPQVMGGATANVQTFYGAPQACSTCGTSGGYGYGISYGAGDCSDGSCGASGGSCGTGPVRRFIGRFRR